MKEIRLKNHRLFNRQICATAQIRGSLAACRISVFEIIGPCMIGPSSSHMAGELKIVLLARELVGEPIKKVTIMRYGSFARTYHGHGTDHALVVGIFRCFI